MIKKGLIIFAILIGLATLYAYMTQYPMIPIGAGYAAKKMCTCHFVAGMSQEQIQEEDLTSIPGTTSVIDEEAKTVTSTVYGMGSRTAVYRKNIGCVLLQGEDDYQVHLDLPEVEKNMTAEWPLGESVVNHSMEGVDYAALDQAIDAIFDPSLDMDSMKTRAVVVVYKDTLIAEKYANGVDENTELLGWSMNKSIVGTLVGIMVKDGKMSLEDDHLFEEWTDERQNIRLVDLLHMHSGLAFNEDYGALSDVNKMLFLSEDMVKDVIQYPLETAIGTKWSYSSGTTNLIAGLIKKEFTTQKEYLAFPHERLFRKIGMHSMVLETDESGNYIGSSYGYATARDWAKFGLLYLNVGNWFGDQIIDTSWVDFVRQATKQSGGLYGGQFWHNQDHVAYEDVPSDLFSCNGFEGQYVFIIPSKDLVVVRLGLSKDIDRNAFLRDIIRATSGNETNQSAS